MTDSPFLNWLLLVVSLFDTILLVWLGLTVLLNAERRHGGIWLAFGGLMMGGLFFISHTAILGHGQSFFTPGLELWWRLGWAPVMALPYLWYAVMLWYSGYWESTASSGGVDSSQGVRGRQRRWFWAAGFLAAGLIAWLILANPIPSFVQVASYGWGTFPAIGGIPLLIVIYPGYIVLCLALSLDALLRPGPTTRPMGNTARQRARPWLVAASLLLLTVCLLVTAVVGRAVWSLLTSSRTAVTQEMVRDVGWADLAISSLIGAATLLLGQAVVAYEVFTGKTLPRRGLARYWQRAIILAAGYSLVIGWSFTLHLRSIYSVLIATLLMTVFYALLSWRSYAERDHLIQSLRPFVTSQQLYERMLDQANAPLPEVDVHLPFQALCEDVLGTQRAALVALGPLAPLWGAPLTYPKGEAFNPQGVAEALKDCQSPRTNAISLDPAPFAGMNWVIPLWSEGGLIGALLLGQKRDGGLYAQEEIEIARATGERLVDTRASVELSRRLMALQRQRLAETQVLDQRTRRLLHDEVLPRLHTALLLLDSDPTSAANALSQAHRQISDLLRDLPAAPPAVIRLGLVGALRQVLDDELPHAFDAVHWEMTPPGEAFLGELPSLTAEVLFYAAREAIRNAARHGRRAQKDRRLELRLSIDAHPNLEIVIEDDGEGLPVAPEVSGGSGQGLVIHSAMLAVVGGTLEIESAPGCYTRVRITLPQP